MNVFNKKNILERDKLISLMELASEGKFVLCNEDEFKDKKLASAYNKLIKSFFKSCNQTTMELNKSMETIGNCNNVQTMLEIVERQKDNLNSAAHTGKDISKSISQCEEILNTINCDAKSTYNTSVLSKDAINETLLNVNQSRSEIIKTSDSMIKFSEKAEAIKDILNLISDIASQTQILALNAKIEASRSNAGEGFAVVADEIGNLSSDTQKTVSKVTHFIQEIFTDVHLLVSQLNDLKILLEKGSNSTENTEQSVQKMADNMQNVMSEISKLYNHINIQNVSIKSFMENMVVLADDSNNLEDCCRKPGKDMYIISRSIDKVRTKYIRGQSNLSIKELLEVYNIDHLIFTGRLYNMIEDFEKLDIRNLNQPKKCKYGKWIQNLQSEQPKLAELFQRANQYHNRLHEFAVLCFNANESGKKEEAFYFFEQAQVVYKNFSDELIRLKNIV